MAGIVSYGSYVPYRRLKRAAIAQVLGVAAGKGERAVASFDEDSVSMAVEALRDALRGAPGPAVQALLFATTTPPYAEKLNAAIVGAAAQLPAEIRAADLTGSVRAGLSATAAGGGRGQWRRVARRGRDGGLPARRARRQGRADQRRRRRGVHRRRAECDRRNRGERSVTREFLDTWRAPGERFAHSWEERFALTQAHAPLLTG